MRESTFQIVNEQNTEEAARRFCYSMTAGLLGRRRSVKKAREDGRETETDRLA